MNAYLYSPLSILSSYLSSVMVDYDTMMRQLSVNKVKFESLCACAARFLNVRAARLKSLYCIAKPARHYRHRPFFCVVFPGSCGVRACVSYLLLYYYCSSKDFTLYFGCKSLPNARPHANTYRGNNLRVRTSNVGEWVDHGVQYGSTKLGFATQELII